MSELLNKAFEAVAKLSQAEQDAIARQLLARIGGAHRRKRSPEQIRKAFDDARSRLTELPVLDPRTPDEILGYGEDGLPK